MDTRGILAFLLTLDTVVGPRTLDSVDTQEFLLIAASADTQEFRLSLDIRESVLSPDTPVFRLPRVTVDDLHTRDIAEHQQRLRVVSHIILR